MKDMLSRFFRHTILETANKLFQTALYPFMAAPALRIMGASVGRNARIYTPLVLSNTRFRNLSIGDNCHIGREVMFDLADKITIGHNVTVSMRSTLITHVNFGDSGALRSGYRNQKGAIVIGDGVYIGAGTTILHGVSIGANAVIGAGALVLHDIPADTVAAGVPADVIKPLPAKAR